MTEIERRDVTLWRVFARYCEAVEQNQPAAAAELDAGFRRRLRD